MTHRERLNVFFKIASIGDFEPFNSAASSGLAGAGLGALAGLGTAGVRDLLNGDGDDEGNNGVSYGRSALVGALAGGALGAGTAAGARAGADAYARRGFKAHMADKPAWQTKLMTGVGDPNPKIDRLAELTGLSAQRYVEKLNLRDLYTILTQGGETWAKSPAGVAYSGRALLNQGDVAREAMSDPLWYFKSQN